VDQMHYTEFFAIMDHIHTQLIDSAAWASPVPKPESPPHAAPVYDVGR